MKLIELKLLIMAKIIQGHLKWPLPHEGLGSMFFHQRASLMYHRPKPQVSCCFILTVSWGVSIFLYSIKSCICLVSVNTLLQIDTETVRLELGFFSGEQTFSRCLLDALVWSDSLCLLKPPESSFILVSLFREKHIKHHVSPWMPQTQIDLIWFVHKCYFGTESFFFFFFTKHHHLITSVQHLFICNLFT